MLSLCEVKIHRLGELRGLKTRSNNKPGSKGEADHVFLRNMCHALQGVRPASVGNTHIAPQYCASQCWLLYERKSESGTKCLSYYHVYLLLEEKISLGSLKDVPC